jgi:hypothetical protein
MSPAKPRRKARETLGKYRDVIRPSGCGDVVDEVVRTLNAEIAKLRADLAAAQRVGEAARAWRQEFKDRRCRCCDDGYEDENCTCLDWDPPGYESMLDAILAGRGPAK